MNLKERAAALKKDLHALYLAYRHERTPWYAKLVIALTVAYALSPVDLIPDFIPVLGYLDDILIVPAGISLSIRLIPPDVMAECRSVADSGEVSSRLRWVVAAIIVFLWLILLLCLWFLLYPLFR